MDPKLSFNVIASRSNQEEDDVEGKAPKRKKVSDEEDEVTYDLSKMRKVKVKNYKGKQFIDIREYYENNGQLAPGKKGIMLTLEQWQKLVDLIPKVNENLH